LALHPADRIEIDARPDQLTPRGSIPVSIARASGAIERFEARVEVETELELRVLRAGGIISLILTEAIAAA
jgi:aconitate hydratase